MSSPSPPRGGYSAAETGGHWRRNLSMQRRSDSPSPARSSGSFFPNSNSSYPELSSSLPRRGSSAGRDKENRNNSSQLSSSRSRTSKSPHGRRSGNGSSHPRGGSRSKSRWGALDHDDGYHHGGGGRGSLESHSHRDRHGSSYHDRSSSHRHHERHHYNNDADDDRSWRSSRADRRHEGDGRSSRSRHSDRSSGRGQHVSNSWLSYGVSRSSHRPSGSRGQGRSYDSNSRVSDDYRGHRSSGYEGERESGHSKSRGASGGELYRSKSRGSSYNSGGDLHRSMSRGPSHSSGGDYGRSLDGDRSRRIYPDSSLSSHNDRGNGRFGSAASSREHSSRHEDYHHRASSTGREDGTGRSGRSFSDVRSNHHQDGSPLHMQVQNGSPFQSENDDDTSAQQFERDGKRSASERNVSTADAKKDTNAKQSKNARTDDRDAIDGLLGPDAQSSTPRAPAGPPSTPLSSTSRALSENLLSATTTGLASSQPLPYPYPPRGRLVNMTQVDPSGDGFPKTVDIQLYEVDGATSDTHAVDVQREEHWPPIGGLKLGADDIAKSWGLPNSALMKLPQLCYLLKLSKNCPREVLKNRVRGSISKRCSSTPLEIDVSEPGWFLGTDWDGLMFWLASRMPEGLNWLLVLLAQAEVDHCISASSPLFRKAGTNQNAFRGMEHFTNKDLHFKYVNGHLKSSHSVHHPLNVRAIDEDGEVMTHKTFYSDDDSERKNFFRWGIDESVASASESSTCIGGWNTTEFHEERSDFEGKMRSMKSEEKLQFIAETVVALYESRKPDPEKLVKEFGNEAHALVVANNAGIGGVGLEGLWDLHEKESSTSEPAASKKKGRAKKPRNEGGGGGGSKKKRSKKRLPSDDEEEDSNDDRSRNSAKDSDDDSEEEAISAISTSTPLESAESINTKYVKGLHECITELASATTPGQIQGHRLRYFLGHCDAWTVVAWVIRNACTGDLSLVEYQRFALLLAQILELPMRLLFKAKRIAIARLEVVYVGGDPLEGASQSISDMLWALDATSAAKKFDQDDVVQAATQATKKFPGIPGKKKRTWDRYALLSQQAKTLLLKKDASLVFMRALWSITVLDFISELEKKDYDEKTLDKIRQFCSSMCDKPLEQLRLLGMYHGLVKAARGSDPDTKKLALNISTILVEELGTNEAFNDNVLLGESVPATVDFETLSPQQLSDFVAANTKPYFCEEGSEWRMKCLARGPILLLWCPDIEKALRQHNLLSKETSEDFCLALICLAWSKYHYPRFQDLFLNEKLVLGSFDMSAKSDLAKVNATVAEICKGATTTIAVFRSDTLFADLTQDNPVRRKTAERFAEFFAYYNAVEREGEEGHGED